MIKKLLLAFLALSTASIGGRALAASYQYSRTVTIPHTQVANSDQTNFPVYLVLNDPGLKTSSNGGHVQSATGADIAFYGDSALTKVLPYEIVSYNGATGSLTAVVNYPSLSHSVDTVFYLAYGMSGAVPAANPTAVWSQYLGVYHLEDNAANTAILNSATGDTTAKSANNTAAMSITGKLGSGLKFNGSSDVLDLGPYSAMNDATAATLSGWVNFAGFSNYAGILARIDSNNAGYVIGLGSSDCCSSDTDWLTTVRAHNGVASFTSGYGIQPGTWYYFTSVFSAGNLSLYINGTQVTLNNFGGVNSVVPAITAELKAATGLNATMDELRISTRAYSQDWITTEYNDMGNPSAFAALGSETVFTTPPPVQTLNVAVLGTTPTQALLSYVAPDNNACTVAVSDSNAVNQFTGVFTSVVHDVDPGLFPGADQDTKSGNLVNGTQRTVVVGHRGVGDGSDGNIYSLALQADTIHYFRISCDKGAYVGTGSFRTADIPLGDSAPDTIPYDANGFGGYGWPTINFADQSTKYIDPQTGALLYRLTGSGDQIYSQYPNQMLNVPIDLSGGAWSNLGNVGSSSDGNSATYSGSGGTSSAMLVYGSRTILVQLECLFGFRRYTTPLARFRRSCNGLSQC